MNFLIPILHHSRTQPDMSAIEDGESLITFGELGPLVARTAGHFAAHGLKPGARIGLCLKDTASHAVALLACGFLGAVAVPIDWRARAKEKSSIIEALDVDFVVAERGDDIVTSRAIERDDEARRAAIDRTAPLDRPHPDINAPFFMNSTSGTTGRPRFTEITHQQAHFRSLDRPSWGRCLLTFPIHFAAGRGRVLHELYLGNTLILGPSLLSGPEFVDLIVARNATAASCVPSLARSLLKIAGSDGLLLPMLQSFNVGGAGLHPEERCDMVRRVTPNYTENYSASAVGTVATLRPSDIPQHADTIGQLSPLVELEVLDEAGRPVPPGTVGELRIRSPKMGRPVSLAGEEPNLTEFRDGWYYPGDFGALDERLFLRLQGRTAEVIVRNGAKIFPAEIEAVLLSIDGVVEAGVVGQGREGEDQTVVAFVASTRPLGRGDLLAACRARLPGYKVPQEFRLLDQMPRNAAGKVDKLALKALLANG